MRSFNWYYPAGRRGLIIFRTYDLAFYIIINQIHIARENKIREYWSKYLDISRSQFRKTSFTKFRQNKVYENYENYYGTLRFKVLKSTDLFYKINGLAEALLATGNRDRKPTLMST